MAGSSTAPIGRPREFDLDEALDRAVEVFWRQGYEATSLTDLTSAMKIGKPSLYAAFGSKEELFRKALDRYTAGPGSYALRAALEPTAKRVAEAFLLGTIAATTRPGSPHGCLGVQAALAASDEGLVVHDLLAEWRDGARAGLEARFRRAREEGDLADGSDPARLARYILTVSNGLAVQAAGGVAPEELRGVVEEALSTPSLG
ncbi:TetR/AcrR family transcriptional regulator [Nocardioides sp. cx-173]|uniref:TetR/AcrR family transcriptional regulator n=1 Tax=Nocardioides sp. cx-173 TaxID=2898796 RepID=UPI001E59FCEA|nr:TetR/AcrR family transcriptional regulator [Nocardioides sp. cx-173]MCD4523677.1 TetR/AcrR family transcriptional regulator [Nocardioides sp. cx-173]UGB41993.1 TetR/AcrR family transcriptional regulator [Nocardioides sp. cx-173]